MAKTQKELAFLRDLYIQDEWTRRFTDLVDKHMDLRDSENMLYINAGTATMLWRSTNDLARRRLYLPHVKTMIF